MSETGKKWLLWGSVIALICSILVLLYDTTAESRTYYFYSDIAVPLLIISGLNLIAFFSLKYAERKWLRITARFSIYAVLIIFLAYFLLNEYTNSYPTGTPFKITLIILFAISISISCLFALIYIFFIKDMGETRWVLGLLLLLVLSLVLERFLYNNNKLGQFLFTAFMMITILTGCGIYLYGVRCLFQVEKNSYLKIISFLACLLIAFGSIVFAAIMSSENVYMLELIYFIPAVLLTLITLLSLPVSGYINWTSLHKKILKKIMISWIFFFMIFSVRYVFPEYFKIIEPKDEKALYQFDMNNYELQNKNGLEPE
jgi:hypothetical protein